MSQGHRERFRHRMSETKEEIEFFVVFSFLFVKEQPTLHLLISMCLTHWLCV